MQAIAEFFALGIPTVGETNGLPTMITSAYEAGQELGCRLYDALYLIVAESLQIQLVTADRVLLDAARRRYDKVVWVEEYFETIEEPSP